VIRRRSAQVLVAAAMAVALGACGSTSAGSSLQPSSISSGSKSALSWAAGDSLRATVDEQVVGVTSLSGYPPQTTEESVTVQQALRVLSVHRGVAELEVRATSWKWRRSGMSRRIEELPSPWRVDVDAGGNVRSGHYWGLADQLPLAGADFFSSGLPPANARGDGRWTTSWSRTLDDGTPLQYQVQGRERQGRQEPTVDAKAQYDLVLHSFTPDGRPSLVQGHAAASIRSSFDSHWDRVLETTYTTTFRRAEFTSTGSAQTDGKVTTKIAFAY
jgi:hypothetical protein